MPSADVVFAELLKARKRWLPYVVLLPVIALIGLQTFAGYFAGWRHDRDFDLLRLSVLPSSLISIVDLGQYLLSIALGILAASVIATEHAWGTVRQAIARGQTRTQYLLMKLTGIGVLAFAGFALVLLIATGFSAFCTLIEGSRTDGPSFAEGVLIIVRGAYTIIPYVLLAFCVTVVGRSTALGVGGILFYIIGESITIGILTGIGGNAADARGFFLGHNVSAVLAANRLFQTESLSLAPRASLDPSELPDPWAAAVVIALYCAAFLAIAFYVFNRRDLEAGSGAT